ncbi:MAG: hypothetical protein OHK0019_38030 [Saprospiraceae bacterium]
MLPAVMEQKTLMDMVALQLLQAVMVAVVVVATVMEEAEEVLMHPAVIAATGEGNTVAAV